jgi:hypothetical protein
VRAVRHAHRVAARPVGGGRHVASAWSSPHQAPG